jgi:hypothetical protein
LALRHAAPVRVESRSWTVQGLARLGGLPHGEPEAFGRRLATDWARLADLDGPGVAISASIGAAWAEGGPDRAVDEASRARAELIEPWTRDPEGRTLVVATGSEHGLALWSGPGAEPGPLPFDERGLDDRRLAHARLAETVVKALAPPVDPG